MTRSAKADPTVPGGGIRNEQSEELRAVRKRRPFYVTGGMCIPAALWYTQKMHSRAPEARDRPAVQIIKCQGGLIL